MKLLQSRLSEGPFGSTKCSEKCECVYTWQPMNRPLSFPMICYIAVYHGQDGCDEGEASEGPANMKGCCGSCKKFSEGRLHSVLDSKQISCNNLPPGLAIPWTCESSTPRFCFDSLVRITPGLDKVYDTLTQIYMESRPGWSGESPRKKFASGGIY